MVEGGDFYRDMHAEQRAGLTAPEGYERYFDWERLRDEVLVPVREQRQVLRYRRYDWPNGALADWVEQSMPDVVIVEGIYTLRPHLRDLIDVEVFVRTDHKTRMQRQVVRGENSQEWIRRWIAAEDFYVAHAEPWQAAQFLVLGD